MVPDPPSGPVSSVEHNPGPTIEVTYEVLADGDLDRAVLHDSLLPPSGPRSPLPSMVWVSGSAPESSFPGGQRPPNVSVHPDDEESEDTLAMALRPLREAERGATSSNPPARASLATLPPDLEGQEIAGPESRHPDARVCVVPVGLEACLAYVGVALMETDDTGAVVGMNAASERLTGWTAAEARGVQLDDVFVIAPPDSNGPEARLAQELGAAPPEHTALMARRDGQVLPVRHVRGLTKDGHGELVVFRDVSSQQLLALQLTRRAHYDELTGLLNRQALAERIDQAILEARRTASDGGAFHGGAASGPTPRPPAETSRATYALLYLDLDSFRLVTTACGHDAGDDLLRWVATRIHELLGPGDCAARIGGDEFAILLVGRDAREAERVARELQSRLLEFRFGWQDKSFEVGASCGVVPFGAEMGTAAEVLSAADHAYHLAKEAGRGRIHTYLASDDQVAEERRSLQWVAGLRRNLEEGRLRLFAQTITPLSARAGKGAHFEVLVRRVDDEGRFLSPVSIIQAAESSGMMDAIDRFVLRQAFRMVGSLPKQALDRLDTCAINLSGVSLLREGLLDYIVKEMRDANVPPSKLCFEVTETAALANLDEVVWVMQELGAMGCRFAVDDFGSGHASYGYLENLPVDYVKIDGMFVRDIGDNALHRAIVESVHRIAVTLGIHTVAEAVETQAVADVLAAMGVDYAQGWLYARPAPMAEVLARL